MKSKDILAIQQNLNKTKVTHEKEKNKHVNKLNLVIHKSKQNWLQENELSHKANTRLFGVDDVEKTFLSLDGEALSLKKNKTKKMIKEKRNGQQNNIVSTGLFGVDVVKNEMKILNSKRNNERWRDPKLKKQQRNKIQTKTH